MSLSRKNFFSSIFLVLSLVVLSLGYLLYIQLNNIDNIKGIVLDELQRATHRDISLKTAKISFAEGLGIELQDVVLHSKSGGKPDFTADSLWVVFRLLPLVNKKIEIKKIVIQGSSIEVIRDATGQLRLGGVPATTSSGGKGLGRYPLLQTYIDKIILRKGVLHFVDHMVSLASKPTILKFQDIDLTVAKSFFKNSVQFVLEGNLSDDADRPSNIRLTGKLKAIPDVPGLGGISLDGKVQAEEIILRKFEPYLDKVFAFIPNETWVSGDADFSGTLDGKLKSSGKLLYSAGARVRGAAFTDPAKSSRGVIEFENTFDKDTIAFQKLSYSSGSFALNVTGGFSDFSSDNPRVRFSVSSSAFRVNDTQSYLPFMLFHAETHHQVQNRFKDGTIEIKSLKFDGALNQLNHLANPQNLRLLSADLYLQGADLGEPWPQIQKVTGSMSLKNGEGIIDIRKAQYRNFEISNLSGRVVDLMNNPVVDWTVEGELDLGQLKQTLKTVMSDLSYERILGPYKNINGMVAAHINFQGPLDTPDNLFIDGELDVAKTSFDQNDIKYPFSDINGKILFHRTSLKETTDPSPWDIRFQDFSGRFGEHTFSELGGELMLVEDSPIRKVWGKFKLGILEAAQFISGPFDGELYDFLQGVRFQGGEVTLDYSSEGNPLAPESIRSKGSVDLKNVSIHHNENFQPLSNISGLVKFDNNKIQLETTKGQYGGSPVKIIAEYLNSSPDPIRYQVQVISDEFSNADFKGVPFLDSLEYDGLAKINVDLKGRGEALSFKNELDLTPISYRYKNIFTKAKGAINKLRVSGRVTKGGGIYVEDLAYQLGENNVRGNMHIKNANDPEYTMNLASHQLEVLPLAKFFKSIQGSQGGELKFDISGKGNLKEVKDSSFRGSVDLTKIVFQPQDFSSPITVSANLRFTDNMYKILRGKAASDRSRIIFSGWYSDEESPKLKLKLSGPALFLEELLPNTESDFANNLNGNKLFAKGSGVIEINLDRFDFDFLQLRKIAGNVSFSEGKVDIPSLDIGARNENLVQLQGKLALDESGKIRFESSLLAENIRTTGFFNIFGKMFRNSLSGKLNLLKAKFDGKGANWKEITSSLDGHITLNLKGGNINTDLLLDGSMELFGVRDSDPSSGNTGEESPFENVSGDFSLVKGVAHTENFQYATLESKMSLVGLFDLNKFEMDTTVGVAPLRTLDKIITKIPVFGKILAGGDEQSIFKTYYLIQGSFEGPVVTSIPFTALGKKVIGTLQGILESPGDIFTPEILGEFNN